jgi:hypothetical protein
MVLVKENDFGFFSEGRFGENCRSRVVPSTRVGCDAATLTPLVDMVPRIFDWAASLYSETYTSQRPY